MPANGFLPGDVQDMKKGRPSKLTPELLEQLEAIADDCWSIRDACERLDISERTWRHWAAGGGGELVSAFLPLAARVRAGASEKTDELAWGALRRVLQDDTASHRDLIAAAGTVLRLRTAQRVELTGHAGGPVQVDAASAREHLIARLDDMAKRMAAADS